jgi:hypothetical protein
MSEYTVVTSVDQIKTHCPKCGKYLHGTYAKEISVYFVWCTTFKCRWCDVYFLMR